MDLSCTVLWRRHVLMHHACIETDIGTSFGTEEAAKQRPRHRPGQRKDGTSDGTMGVSDIAERLMEFNDGVRPKDTEILKLLLQVNGG